MSQDSRLLAATGATITALRNLAGALDHQAAIVVLNLADLLHQARGEGNDSEMLAGDRMLAEHIDRGISELRASPNPTGPENGFSAGFMAECALAGLKDTARDVAWIERQARENAAALFLRHGVAYESAMALPRNAAAVSAAIAKRIEMLGPEIGRVVAECSRFDQDVAQRITH